MTVTQGKCKRGIASMSPEKKREVTSKGGQRAHELGRAYEWTSGPVAQEAGRKGGLAAARKRREKQKGHGQ